MTVNSKLSYLYSVVKMLFLLCFDHIVSKILICLQKSGSACNCLFIRSTTLQTFTILECFTNTGR